MEWILWKPVYTRCWQLAGEIKQWSGNAFPSSDHISCVSYGDWNSWKCNSVPCILQKKEKIYTRPLHFEFGDFGPFDMHFRDTYGDYRSLFVLHILCPCCLQTFKDPWIHHQHGVRIDTSHHLYRPIQTYLQIWREFQHKKSENSLCCCNLHWIFSIVAFIDNCWEKKRLTLEFLE